MSDREKMFLAADAISMRMIALLFRNDTAFHARYDTLGDDDEKEVLHGFPKNSLLSPDDSASVLQDLMRRNEQRIAALAGTESREFWLQLTARIPPKPLFGSRPDTAFLYRSVLKLAILKYGSDAGREFLTVPQSVDLLKWALDASDDEPPPVEGDEPKILIPVKIAWEDALHAYQLEQLAYLFYITTAELRRVWKGGRVKLRDGWIQTVEASEEAEQLMLLYDRRQLEYGALLSGFGSAADVEPRRLGDETRLALVVPILNVEQHHLSEQVLTAVDPSEWPEEPFDPSSDFVPNYLPKGIELSQVYNVYSIFEQELRFIWNVTSAEFLSFLLAVTHTTTADWILDLGHRFTWLQRGYTLTPSIARLEQVCVETFQKFMREQFDQSTEPARFREIASVLTYDENAFNEISLWDRSGFKLLLSQHGLVIDHAVVPLLLREFISVLGLKRGTIGVAKGQNFEDEVKRQASIDGIEEWAFRRPIHFRRHFPESGGEREVDWGFIINHTLVIVECKAGALSPALDRGEPAVLALRQTRLDKALAKVDSLCEALAKEPEGADFHIPIDVYAILAVVCTPFPEYIGQLEDRWFLKQNVPRVCVPNELRAFLEDFQPEAYTEKPWLYKVAR